MLFLHITFSHKEHDKGGRREREREREREKERKKSNRFCFAYYLSKSSDDKDFNIVSERKAYNVIDAQRTDNASAIILYINTWCKVFTYEKAL